MKNFTGDIMADPEGFRDREGRNPVVNTQPTEPEDQRLREIALDKVEKLFAGSGNVDELLAAASRVEAYLRTGSTLLTSPGTPGAPLVAGPEVPKA